MSYKRRSKSSKLETVLSYALFAYVIFLVFSVFFLLIMVIVHKIKGDNIYLVFLATGIFGSLISLVPFIVLALHFLKTFIYDAAIYTRNAFTGSLHDSKGSFGYYVLAVVFTLFLGAFAFIATDSLVNTVKDYYYLNNPSYITLYDTRLSSRRTNNNPFIGKRYEVYGYDEHGNPLDFFLVDGHLIKDEFNEIEITYLPNSNIVLEFKIK